MPRYHFNVYDGGSDLDSEGSELPDDGASRREGIRLASAILDDSASDLSDGNWRLEVTDDRGVILFRLDLIASTLPGEERPWSG